MYECDQLVSVLKGEYNIPYEKFERAIVEYIQKCMFFIYANYCEVDELENISGTYFPSCKIIKSLDSDGEAQYIDTILLKRDTIINLFRGDKINLLIIFHELSHIEYNIQILRGYSTLNIINQIKDFLLNSYQKEQNSKYYYDDPFDYYKYNYRVVSQEVDANLNAIALTTNFMKINNINDSDIFHELSKKYEEFSRRKKIMNRFVGGNVLFNNIYLSLDEAFSSAIKDNPFWLEVFPQLKVEYEIVDGVIVKKKNIIYQEYNDVNSLYYRVKQYIKE